MKKGLLGGVAAIAVVAAAGASAPAAAQDSNLTGPYAGAHFGWGFGDTDLIVGTKNEEGHFWEIGDDIDGVLGGFQLGFDTPVDTRFGSLVAGLVGDFSFADIDGIQLKGQGSEGRAQFVGHDDGETPPGGPPGKFKTSIDNLATVRLRLGVPTGDQTLFYVHGGLAMAEFDLDEVGEKSGPWNEDPLDSSQGWDLGWVVGAGVEHRVQDIIPAEISRVVSDLSLFAEYSYMEFGSADLILATSGEGSSFQGTVNRADRDLHLIKVGVNIRFDSFLSGNTKKTAANRHRPDAVPSTMTPAKVSKAQPLAREPKPRIVVAALAPSKEPLSAVVPASTRLDTGSRLAKPKQPYDRGLVSGSDNAEARNPVLPAMFAAKDDSRAPGDKRIAAVGQGQPVAAVQKEPEKKPVEPESFVKSSEGVVTIVFAPQEARRGVVDRGSRDYIKWVQRSLNQLLSTRLDVDGVMGRRTSNVIRSFQRQAGIEVDGIVGPQTEDALIKAGASSTRAA
jgi:opacity protein-like surface antigen